MKFDVSGIFWGVLLIVGGGELISFEDPSLNAHGYQLLPLATSQLLSDNREFDVSSRFWGVLLIVGGGELMTIEDQSLRPHGYQLKNWVVALNDWMLWMYKYSFQMQFVLPRVWPNQHFYVSVSFLAFCSIFLLCRSQCESEPFPQYFFQMLCTFAILCQFCTNVSFCLF